MLSDTANDIGSIGSSNDNRTNNSSGKNLEYMVIERSASTLNTIEYSRQNKPKLFCMEHKATRFLGCKTISISDLADYLAESGEDYSSAITNLYQYGDSVK